MDDVVAYTVFSTQHPTRITLSLKDALHTLTDEDIVNMVVWQGQPTELAPYLVGDGCGDSNAYNYPWQWLIMNVRIPRWQKGEFPYLLSGGETHFNMENGKIVIPDEHEIVPVELAIPCDKNNTPNPYIVVQYGNGASALNATNWAAQILSYEFKGSADVLLIGAGDLISGADRKHYPGIVKALKLINSVADAGSFSDNDILPAIRNGYFNPVAARGNMRQAAAESYLLKRVAENLATIMERQFTEQRLAENGLSLANFWVDTSRAGIMGFSQGANNGIVNMAIADRYDFAYFASGTGTDLPLVSRKPLVSQLLQIIFPNLRYDELDDFQPIASFVQMAFEAMESSNYVSHINPRNIFITAGRYDESVPAASTEHLALSLARRGLMQATAGEQGSLLHVPSIQTLGVPPIYDFPITGNIRSGQGTGVYSYGNHGHDTCGDVSGFLYSASRGEPAVLRGPCR